MTKLDGGTVNLNMLRKMYSESKPAQALLDHFARRKNSMRQTTVDRLLTLFAGEGIPLSRGELIEVLKGLEAIGCGEFRIGRRGWPSRFEWRVDLVSVGQAASGERKEIEDISGDEVEEEPEQQLFAHTYQLRPGYQVKFELPADLKSREAGRLADFIKTLPFRDGEI